MARSLHLSFICIPQSTRALDQGGVEPRQAVSPRPGGQGRYRFATASAGDLDTVINQLVFRGHGDLEQFVDDRDLFIRVVGEIMTEFNMQQPSSAITSHEVGPLGTEEVEGDKKWIRIFWGQEHVGPDDREQWRDHDL